MKRWTRGCLSASLSFFLWAAGGPRAGAGAIEPMILPTPTVESVSGQFVISVSQDYSTYEAPIPLAAQATALRLEPSLVSVTSERIKNSLWQTFGAPPGARWQGNIFIVLHPLRHWGSPIPIQAQQGERGLNYRVDLPDALPKAQFVRALASAILFELAEHNTSGSTRSPELPAWLVDGLTQQLLTDEFQDLVVVAPKKLLNGLPQAREEASHHGVASLAEAHRVLQQNAPLTFAQMSWPTADQLAGNDGGVYLASAQVFVTELLALRDGPARLSAFLTRLPWCENWQTAFQDAYQPLFAGPLGVEKWWSLRVVSFAAEDPGPTWTADTSRRKLDEILQVPVEIRANSNSLPDHAEIPLQEAVLKIDYRQQEAVFDSKIRELGVARLRLAAPLADLAEEYRQVLSDYMGRRIDVRVSRAGRSTVMKAGAPETIKKLNRLDARRRFMEARIKPDRPVLPQN